MLWTVAHRHVRYCDRVYFEKTPNLDESLVKEYFPLSVVILKIYQDLLGVKFVETLKLRAQEPRPNVNIVQDCPDMSDWQVVPPWRAVKALVPTL